MGLEMVFPEARTVCFCEIEPYAQKILAKRFPGVPIVADVHDLTIDTLASVLHNDANTGGVIDMGAHRKNYDEAVKMYEAGLSIQDVGDYYGVTRQSMHDTLKRRDVKFRPQRKYGEDNHFYRGGVTAEDRSQNLAERAFEKGILIPEPCEICGEFGQMKDGRRKVQAHHDDYSKPLEVRWLCQKHHHEWHKANKAKNGKEVPKEAPTIDTITAGFP